MSQSYGKGLRKPRPKINNQELKTVLFRYGITNEDVSKRLGIARQTYNYRLNRGLLTQLDLKVILGMLQEIDGNISSDIFFAIECDK